MGKKGESTPKCRSITERSLRRHESVADGEFSHDDYDDESCVSDGHTLAGSTRAIREGDVEDTRRRLRGGVGEVSRKRHFSPMPRTDAKDPDHARVVSRSLPVFAHDLQVRYRSCRAADTPGDTLTLA